MKKELAYENIDGGKIPVTIIKPRSGWQLIDFAELRRYKDLFYFLVWRDIKVLYKQTVMGFAWALFRPVLSMVIFTAVFGGLANIPSDGIPYPIFSYAALLPWTYFSTAMTNSTNSLITSTTVFTKVYYPRIMIPLTPVLAGLVDFAIASVLLFGMMLYYGVFPSANAAFLPVLLILLFLTAAGIGMWLSAMAIQYRDIKHVTAFLSQLLMFTAPVVWPVSLITEKFPEHGQVLRLIYGVYPMAGVIEGFRSSLLGTRPMPWDLIIVGSISALLLFFSGALYFRKKEKVFADVA